MKRYIFCSDLHLWIQIPAHVWKAQKGVQTETVPLGVIISTQREAHWENVWELPLIMLSVTNQPWPLSPQDTHVRTYGCDDNFWRIYRYKHPFTPLSLLWWVDQSAPAGTVCVCCIVQGLQHTAHSAKCNFVNSNVKAYKRIGGKRSSTLLDTAFGMIFVSFNML